MTRVEDPGKLDALKSGAERTLESPVPSAGEGASAPDLSASDPGASASRSEPGEHGASPAELGAPEVADIKAIYDLAKIGLHKAPWKPAPRMAAAYRRIRSYLLDVGALPR